MELNEAIRSRRSVRAFEKTPVQRELIEKLLIAATWAPSPMNAQPWSFIVLTGAKRDALVGIISQYTIYLQDLYKGSGTALTDMLMESVNEFAEDLGGAPVIIIITVPKSHDKYWQALGKISAAMAAQNLMLAAYAEGLGTLHLTSCMTMEHEIKTFLAIQDDDIYVVMPLGYWRELPAPPERKAPKVSWLGFD